MAISDKSIDLRLLKSAQDEFWEKGFLNAELKTICENAGITTGALYKRYKGKEDLFAAVVEDIVNELMTFLEMRANVDFSLLSDMEVYNSWIMTYDDMIVIFKLLYAHKEKFTLLVEKAAGTKYENFNHEFVEKMSYAYEKFFLEAKKRGLSACTVTRKEFHVLLSSFWTCICEPIIHGMSWKQIEEHCRIICRFFNWKDVIMIQGEKECSKK